jgi:hypothetical protein
MLPVFGLVQVAFTTAILSIVGPPVFGTTTANVCEHRFAS